MLSLDKWSSWVIICCLFLFALWLFIGQMPHNNTDDSPSKFQHIHESPMLPHLPKNIHIDAPIKSPFIMDDVIESVKENEHEINCTPVLPEGLIKTKVPEGKHPYKKRMDSKGEQLCREIFEDIHDRPFPKIKPGFIRNPETHALLELDGYSSELGIAFEYNGIQHYTWPNFTGQTYNDFKSQVRRDQFKLECCDRHNVYLITIPYSVPHEDLRQFITYYLPENVAKRLKANQDTKSSGKLDDKQ